MLVPVRVLAGRLRPGQQSRWRWVASGMRFKSTSADPKLRVYFGTQTGTAQMFAIELEEEARARDVPVSVASLGDVEPSNVPQDERMVLITSCYGSGEPTDSAKQFFSWLMSDEAKSAHWSDTHYAVFGLGNKIAYPERYNKVSRDIDARLKELGAVEICDRGEGDDSQDIETDFETWQRDVFWPKFEEHKSEEQKTAAQDHQTLLSTTPSQNKYQLIIHGTKVAEEEEKAHRPGVLCEVSKIVQLHTPLSERSCKHIKLEIPIQSGVTYEAGNYLEIWPENDEDLVNTYLKRLGVHGDTVVSLVPLEEEGHGQHSKFPPALSLYTLFKKYMDLQGMPRKSLIRMFALNARDPVEKHSLSRLCDGSPESKVLYDEMIKGGKRRPIDLLYEYPSIGCKIEHFLELIPPLARRAYSISSSPKEYPHSIALTVGSVETLSPEGRRVTGTCSEYLHRLRPGDKVKCIVQPCDFKLPEDPKHPVIFIAGGNGMAPIRGFLRERMWMVRNGIEVGEATFFFGCRDARKDFIYEDECYDAVSQGALTSFFPVFSHQNGAAQPYFVHYEVLKQEQLIGEMLGKGASVYICGNTPMALELRAAFATIISNTKDVSYHSGQRQLMDMMDRGQYHEDAFT